MELRIENGDYLSDGNGGVLRCSGADALLQRVLFRLTARRGMLPMLPELGSNLYLLSREKPSTRLAAARQYVAQAVEPEGLSVRELVLADQPDGSIAVTVWLEGTEGVLTVTVAA